MSIPWLGSTMLSPETATTLRKIESWISFIFWLLFLLTIGPWLLFLLYDVALYLFRTLTYELPFVGGRARGRERPRAPSLRERPTGDPRLLGMNVSGAGFGEDGEDGEEREEDAGAELIADGNGDGGAAVRKRNGFPGEAPGG